MNGTAVVNAIIGTLILVLGLARLILVARRRQPHGLRTVSLWLPILVWLGAALSILAHLAGWPTDVLELIDAAILGASIYVFSLLMQHAFRLSYEHNNPPTEDGLDHVLADE